MITTKLKNRLLKLSNELVHCIPFQSKHFTYILYRNNVLSVGYNTNKTSPLAHRLGYYHKFKFGIHSEIQAILNFGHDQTKLRRCWVINLRLSAAGRLKMAKPCPICQKSLAKFGIRDIMYSDNEGNFLEMNNV